MNTRPKTPSACSGSAVVDDSRVALSGINEYNEAKLIIYIKIYVFIYLNAFIY